MSKKITTWAALLITLVLLVSLFVRLNPEILIEKLGDMNFGFIALALIPLVFEVSLKALRTQLLAKRHAPITLRTAYIVTLVGFPFATVTPGRLGDFVKFYTLAKKTNMPLSKSIAIGVLEKTSDFLSLFALVFISMALISLTIGLSLPLLIIAAFVCIGVLVSILILNERFLNFTLRMLLRAAPGRYHPSITYHFHSFSHALLFMRREKILFALTFVLTGFLWINRMTQEVIFFTQALNISVSLGFFVMVIPITFVVEVLPISIMGLGVREYAFVLLFALNGIPAEASVLVALFVFTLGILPSALLGYMVAVKEYGGVKKLKIPSSLPIP